MENSVFLLVLVSAFIHAVWNFILRKQSGNLVNFWFGACITALAFGLACIAYTYLLAPSDLFEISSLGLSCIFFSAVSHAIYFSLLGKAYGYGDITIVYPISRGTGVGLTAIVAVLVLNELVTGYGLIGILSILLGVLFVKGKKSIEESNRKACFLAFLVGISITMYNIIDKIGANQINPFFYLASVQSLGFFLMTPYIFHQYKGQIGKEVSQNWRSSLGIGLGVNGGYSLILFAYTLGEVSYIVAARESSVVIGCFLGVYFLGEELTKEKLLGIVAIVAGLILLKLS